MSASPACNSSTSNTPSALAASSSRTANKCKMWPQTTWFETEIVYVKRGKEIRQGQATGYYYTTSTTCTTSQPANQIHCRRKERKEERIGKKKKARIEKNTKKSHVCNNIAYHTKPLDRPDTPHATHYNIRRARGRQGP